MFSQLPCLGVWWTSKRSASRDASAGPDVSYRVDSLWVFRLSITRTIFLSGKWTSAMSASSPAKSLFVRRSVTFTWRHASSGAYTMNRFAVPLRPYPESYAAGCPGRVGSGVRVSPVCCFEVPSMTARTVPSSYSRLQVFRTSSMAQTNSAFSFGGMHQHSLRQGLMSFFSDAMGRAAVCLRG